MWEQAEAELMKYIGIDFGSASIKVAIIGETHFNKLKRCGFETIPSRKYKSSLHTEITIDVLVNEIKEFVVNFDEDLNKIAGIGLCTTGIVNYHGNSV